MDGTLTQSGTSAVPEVPGASDPSAPAMTDPPIGVGGSSGLTTVPDRTGASEPDEALRSAFQAQLDDPALVLSPDYIGADRRRRGLRARVARATFRPRRSLLRMEVLVVAVVAVMVAAALVTVGQAGRKIAASPQVAASTGAPARGRPHVSAPAVATPVRARAVTAPRTTPATTTPVTPAPTAVAAAPAATVTPATTPPPTVAPSTTVPPAAPATAPVATTALTPDQMGAEALALVRYPWKSIPGYSIQFLPIADAPSPGFYGNTTFTWGQVGGTSDLYVYPGETVDQLAGIIAFEIGHEVDAAAVEPQGGETQIENILGLHPASWAPNCDCAEQGFLSGWYAASFSNYWSPGVGDWSQIAPEPTGAVLAAVEPWFNPRIP